MRSGSANSACSRRRWLRCRPTEERLIAWVAPPFVPYAPALRTAGIDLDKLLLVHATDHARTLWALEQALKTGVCSAVLGWLSESRLKFAEIRRLQFAARQGGTWSGLFRPAAAAGTASPAELRLRLSPHREGLRLDIVKRRGGWPLSGPRTALRRTSGQRCRQPNQRSRQPAGVDQAVLWLALHFPHARPRRTQDRGRRTPGRLGADRPGGGLTGCSRPTRRRGRPASRPAPRWRRRAASWRVLSTSTATSRWSANVSRCSVEQATATARGSVSPRPTPCCSKCAAACGCSGECRPSPKRSPPTAAVSDTNKAWPSRVRPWRGWRWRARGTA